MDPKLVSCASCNQSIGHINNFCFYIHQKDQVQFIVKSEIAQALLISDNNNVNDLKITIDNSTINQSNKKFHKSDVKCGHCQEKIGTRMATGPSNQQVTSFGIEKVSILGQSPFGKSKKWKNEYEHDKFKNVDRRDQNSFFPSPSSFKKVSLQHKELHKICFASNEDDFKYEDIVTSGKQPFDYQRKAYQFALLSNTIIVLPTGYGKTFIAAMLFHRMRILNNNLIPVMIVERVPLAYQQKHAIEEDTGLHICALCGESKTMGTLRRISEGVFDALVVTAGVLIECLRQNILRINDFSIMVFDECHHCTGQHNYNKILEFVSDLPRIYRPRLVGLSASPVKSSSGISAAAKRIKELEAAFLGAHFLQPSAISTEHQQSTSSATQFCLVTLHEDQLSFHHELSTKLYSNMHEIKPLLPVDYFSGLELTLSLCKAKANWPRITQILALGQQYVWEQHSEKGVLLSLIKSAKALMCDLNVNYLLGPIFLQEEMISGTSTEISAFLEKNNTKGVSAQLKQLCNRIEEHKHNEESRILVFVEQRATAVLLHKFLCALFPSLHCQYLVGHGGLEGMDWKGEKGQENVLNNFRFGQSQLIVCTSVLEEGIDVQRCNLVIRLCGEPSLIQLVQSKGRARHEQGKFVVIYTKEEEEHYAKVRSEEQIVHAAIETAAGEQSARLYCSDLRDINTIATSDVDFATVETLVNKLTCAEGETGPSTLTPDGLAMHPDARMSINKQYSFALKLYIHSNDPNLQSTIVQLLNDLGVVTSIEKVEVFPEQASADISATNVFDEIDSLAIISVVSARKDFELFFAGIFDFKIKGNPTSMALMQTENIKFVSQQNVNAQVTTGTVTVSGIHQVEVGYFEERQMFRPASSLSKYEDLTINRGKELILERSHSDKKIQVKISIFNLQHCVYLSLDRKDNIFTAYIFLKAPPVVLINDQRVAVPNGGVPNALHKQIDLLTSTQEDLAALASCPVLAVSFTSDQWKSLRDLLSDSSTLGLPVLVTRVDHQAKLYSAPESFDLQASVSCSLASDLAESLLSFWWQCVWAYNVLETSTFCLPLTQNLLHLLRKEVMTTLNMIHGTIKQEATVNIAPEALSRLWKCMHYLQLLVADIHPFHNCSAALLKFINQNRDCMGIDASADATNSGDILPPNSALVCRILVTPSRIVALPSVPMQTNRLIRRFGEQYQLVYVTFRDEQGQSIYNTDVFNNRFKDMISNGFDLCGLHYSFLLCSASQLREQTAVFIVGGIDIVREIRSSLIPDLASCGEGYAKYVSRLGLFCTSDMEVYQLSEGQFRYESDIITVSHTGNKQILTDGAGRIKQSFRDSILKFYYDEHGFYPSVVQIRSLGCKGILVNDPNLVSNEVVFRDSMRKCESAHRALCVVKCANYNPLRLNREIINLLLSFKAEGRQGGNWSPHNAFIQLQDEELDKLVRTLTNESCAIEQLVGNFDRSQLELVQKCGINILQEPFWKALLQLKYFDASMALRKKTHIPLDMGCLLMGAPDLTGLLQDGEVFFCMCGQGLSEEKLIRTGSPFEEDLIDADDYARPKLSRFANEDGVVHWIVTGDIIIYRNPCLDPGDVRCVRAIDRPELRRWVNCLLMPCNGVRNLSAECSGGDLDGDSFAIIWDPRLRPRYNRRDLFPAVDYAMVAEQGKKKIESRALEPGNENSIFSPPLSEADFVSRTMCNASLGRIANLHLALCDQLPYRAANSLAREVAKEQSLAVDYPKTGVPPDVPKAAKELVKGKGYPDFMENKTKPSYVSDSTLGDLYHTCISTCCDVDLTFKDHSFLLDELLITPLSGDFMEGTKIIYERYKVKIRRILTQYGLQSEAEIVLGLPRMWQDEFSLNHNKVSSSLQDIWSALYLNMREEFNEFVAASYSRKSNDTFSHCGFREIRLDVASAWYRVAYQDSKQYHSFAWCLLDLLCTIRTKALERINDLQIRGSGSIDGGVCLELGVSILKWWRSCVPDIRHAVSLKVDVFRRLQQCLGEAIKPLEVKLFGSVALLLSDYESDIDLFANLVNADSQKQSYFEHQSILEEYIVPIVGNIATSCRISEAAGMPLIKLEIADGNQVIHVDICAKKDGFAKASLIRTYYAHDPIVLPLFYSIVQWARDCGLLRGPYTAKSSSVLNSGQLQALVLSFLLNCWYKEKLFLETNIESAEKSAEWYLQHSDECDEGQLGLAMMRFFWYYAKYDNEFEFEWPIESKPSHKITLENMKQIASRCKRALHFLAVSRDWPLVLMQSQAFEYASTRLTQPLSKAFTNSIGDTKEFHAMRLSSVSRAKVTIEFNKEQDCLVVHAIGTCHQIQVLRKEIQKLIYLRKALGYGSIISRSSAYFMEGSTLLYVKNSDSPSAMLSLDPWIHGVPYAAHQLREISTPYLRSGPVKNWQESFCAAMVNKIISQLVQMTVSQSETLSMEVHFGRFYIMDATKSFARHRGAVSCAFLETAMSNGRRNRQFASADRAAYNPSSTTNLLKGSIYPDGNSNTRKRSNSSGKLNLSDGRAHLSRQERKQACISSSFIPNLSIPLEALKSEKKEAEILTYFSSVFDSIGFQLVPTDTLTSLIVNTSDKSLSNYMTAESSVSISLPIYSSPWQVEVSASASYTANIQVGHNMEIEFAHERSLRWVHATLCNGSRLIRTSEGARRPENSENPNEEEHMSLEAQFKLHDLRIKLGTVKVLSKEEDLYKVACPGDKPPIKLNADGRPVICNEVGGKGVSFARHVNRRYVFGSKTFRRRIERAASADETSHRNCKDLNIMAVLSFGHHYEGENLAVEQPMVDLALKIDTEPLREWIAHEHSKLEDIKIWLYEATKEILKISDVVSERWDELIN